MSKTLRRTLITALLLFAGLGQFNHSQGLLAKPDSHSSTAQGSRNRVEVTFDGLMVFQRVGDHYEVGVLGKDAAPRHEFKIIVGNKEMNIPSITGGNWSLHVENSSQVEKPADIWPRQSGPCNRLQDTLEGSADLEHVFDFCWIMDMENEFNGGQTLSLKPNLLMPIISLKNGELYTKFKYDQLQLVPISKRRPKRVNRYTGTDFGFIAETIAIRVDLQEREHLVLRGSNREIVFQLPDGSDRSAGLYNAPAREYPHMQRGKFRPPSHFVRYYGLFSNAANGNIDIDPKPGGLSPLNRWFPPGKQYRTLDDETKMMTVDDYACGAVLLGKRIASLSKPDVTPRR